MAGYTTGTQNVWPHYSSQNVQRTARTPQQELGREQFLQLLVTQLANQNPLEPMQDREFIAQMAQFSALEQMMNVAKELNALRQSAALSANLIGMEIGWTETDDTGAVVNRRGVVDSIVVRNGEVYAKVGDAEIKADDIVYVGRPAATQPEEPEETPSDGQETPAAQEPAEAGEGA
ncbi:MAG TPA: flagellar hook capping FlgD N-terminal domain-containing protein [Paenibacillaceae bacterium]